jgi:predicted GIY-YIG superfamily endonuclease
VNFHDVYILQSKIRSHHFYTDLTDDLHARLKKHNNGEVAATKSFRPWKIKTAIAFTDRESAAEFELYLKSASGRAFAKKRL